MVATRAEWSPVCVSHHDPALPSSGFSLVSFGTSPGCTPRLHFVRARQDPSTYKKDGMQRENCRLLESCRASSRAVQQSTARSRFFTVHRMQPAQSLQHDLSASSMRITAPDAVCPWRGGISGLIAMAWPRPQVMWHLPAQLAQPGASEGDGSGCGWHARCARASSGRSSPT